MVQYSIVVLARWKACRFAFCLLETGVVGSKPTPGHGSVSALVLCKYRPPGTATPKGSHTHYVQNSETWEKVSLGPDCRVLPLKGVRLQGYAVIELRYWLF